MADREKEGYWTPIEKQTRDYLLIPITWPFKFIPYAANLVTFAGFVLLFSGMRDYFLTQDLTRQLWFLSLAWITDFLDGPIARNNNNVTALGTLMDHVRDYCIMFWMIALVIVLASRTPEFLIILILLIFTTLGLLGVIAGTILYQRGKRGESRILSYFSFFQEFLLHDLVTTVTARIHTFVLALGGIFYVAGAVLGPTIRNIGLILLIVQLFVLGFYLHEIFQSRYEDQAYKIRVALQTKIEQLEEKLNKIMKRRKLKKK